MQDFKGGKYRQDGENKKRGEMRSDRNLLRVVITDFWTTFTRRNLAKGERGKITMGLRGL